METFVFWTLGVLIFLTVSIIVFTLHRRVLSGRIDRRMQELETPFDQLVESAGTSNAARVSEILPDKNFPFFERYLRNKINTTDAMDVTWYRVAANESGFADHLRRRAKKKRGWKKALALRSLSYLRDPADIPLFREVLETQTFHPCVYAAGLGLALCGDTESLHKIAEKVYLEENPNRELLLTVLYPFGRDAAPQMHRLLDEESLPVTETCVFVDLLGIFRYGPAEKTLEKMLERAESTEIKIHVIEALGYIGDDETCRLLVPYFEDEEFRVRLKAVNSLGRLGGERYVDEIEKFVYDEDWWVRKNAAETLYYVGPAGRERLDRIAASEEGPARSSARLALEEMKFNRERWRYRYAEPAA